ncbi:MAG: LiaF-related protein [Actinomycetota bacterium]|nr:LiaF-related protein [Actinomycetota bacterium]
MRLLKRVLLGVILLNVLLVAAAQVAKRMLPAYGDESSDVFAAVAAMDGAEIVNRSDSFRAGSGTAVMGGMTIDLTEAEISTSATLELTAIAGGIDVTVPARWRVEMASTVFAGGTDNLTDPDAAADEAPLLLVDARAYFGGIAIRSIS